MSYSRPPFPRQLFARFCKLALALGYSKRGQKWKLLDLLLAYAERHDELFRKR